MMDLSHADLVLPEPLASRLWQHHFPGDHDEHGSVILAGIIRDGSSMRLLARELYLATDGIDYVEGQRGYRMLRGEFTTPYVLRARDENLVYLAIHNHGGSTEVGFSADDLASQRRGYPALLDIAGLPVGAVVIAERAVAGNIWISAHQSVELSTTRIVGMRTATLTASPKLRPSVIDPMYDRQARLFGDAGQDILRGLTVGVIGVGGVGTLLVEYLARLGVGHLVLGDPDRVSITNIPRLPHATRFDARAFLTDERRPDWMRRIGERIALKKVDLAARICRRANPAMGVTKFFGDITDNSIARTFAACDFLFLAADSMQARLVFNALCMQYLIPGWQVGSKVVTNRTTGEVTDVYSVVRPVMPGAGCLMCNELISAAKLQEESLDVATRERQRYVDDPEVVAPSVITLNAIAASHAANEFLFSATGLAAPDLPAEYQRFVARDRVVISEEIQSRQVCRECSTTDASRFARGDARRLPTRHDGRKEVKQHGKDPHQPRQVLVED
jgi:molybdopterin/thiamine biosynthesis adenylyltransferase